MSNLHFLSNPLVALILAVTVLLIVGGVLFFLSKRQFTFSKEGGLSIVDATRMSMARHVPELDLRCKAGCREILLDSKEAVLGALQVADKIQLLFVWSALETVMRGRIIENNLVVKFSDKGNLQHWKERCATEIVSRLRYIGLFTCIAFDYETIEMTLLEALSILYKNIYEVVTRTVKEKIDYYQSLSPSEKAKGLIERNQNYLENLKAVRYAAG